MIFGSCKFISSIEASSLACSVLIVSIVELLCEQTSTSIIIATEIQVFSGTVSEQWADLPGPYIGCDLDVMNSEVKIIGVQDPDIRNRVIESVHA